MPNEPTDLVEQTVTVAEYDALRNIAQRLKGLLWHLEQNSPDPEARERAKTERLDVRDRFQAIVPGSPRVTDALTEWGARVRELSP